MKEIKIRKAHLAPKRDHIHEDKTKAEFKICSACRGSGFGKQCLTPCDHCQTVCEATRRCHACKGEGLI